MEKSFDGKVALVTGGGSGIGEAIAHQLADAGASVVVADLKPEAAERVAAAIKSKGGKAVACAGDVSSEKDVEAMVKCAVDTYGGLHAAVNNAGIGGAQKPVAELTLEEWRQVQKVNLDGVFLCMKHEINAMTGGGSIVNIASILGTNGFASASAYVAAKHGVVGLTKTAALEYSDKGIRINAVGPGFIDTPLLSGLPKEAMPGIVALHPIGRLGKSDEVAALTVFLLSDAAGFITGSYHLVDGGYSAR